MPTQTRPDSVEGEAVDTAAIVKIEQEIARRLRAMRETRDTQNGILAESLGMSYSAIAKIMAGKAVRQFAKLAILAKVMRTTPNALLGFSEDPDKDRLRAAMEAGLIAWGIPEDGAIVTAEAILSTVYDPPPNIAGRTQVPPEDILRIQVDAAVRQVLRGHSQPALNA